MNRQTQFGFAVCVLLCGLSLALTGLNVLDQYKLRRELKAVSDEIHAQLDRVDYASRVYHGDKRFEIDVTNLRYAVSLLDESVEELKVTTAPLRQAQPVEKLTQIDEDALCFGR